MVVPITTTCSYPEVTAMPMPMDLPNRRSGTNHTDSQYEKSPQERFLRGFLCVYYSDAKHRYGGAAEKSILFRSTCLKSCRKDCFRRMAPAGIAPSNGSRWRCSVELLPLALLRRVAPAGIAQSSGFRWRCSVEWLPIQGLPSTRQQRVGEEHQRPVLWCSRFRLSSQRS